MRYDDTNPEKEEEKFFKGIRDIGVVHQIVSPISNFESTNFFKTNIYFDNFFSTGKLRNKNLEENPRADRDLCEKGNKSPKKK